MLKELEKEKKRKEKKRKEKEIKHVAGGEGDENGEENKREVVWKTK